LYHFFLWVVVVVVVVAALLLPPLEIDTPSRDAQTFVVGGVVAAEAVVVAAVALLLSLPPLEIDYIEVIFHHFQPRAL